MSARLVPTGVSTMGGRGQEAPVPEGQVMHIATMTTTSTTRYEDWFATASEALESRVKRLKEARTPHTVDGMTLTFMDAAGTETTITYEEPM